MNGIKKKKMVGLAWDGGRVTGIQEVKKKGLK